MFSQLIGLWMYSGLIFHGAPISKPSPELVIYFQFSSQTENSLFYFRQGQRGFCERTAQYTIKKNYLAQTVKSTNEENADVCSSDPDMQIGKFSMTRFEIVNDQLYLYLSLGDDELIYVWSKVQ
jgi:hypothetical protein